MPLSDNYRTYASTLWDRLSALATWQPDVRVTVGDIVATGAGGVIGRQTSLAELGIDADRLRPSRGVAAAVGEHSGVSIDASGSASVASAASAHAQFSSQASFLMVTAEGRLDSVLNMAEARRVVEEVAKAGDWQSGWHLVTSVRTYPACTVVIAKNAGVRAGVTLDLSAAGLTPGAVQAGAAVKVNSDEVSVWAMPFETTPLFEAIGMRRRILRRRAVGTSSRYLTRDNGPEELEESAAESADDPAAFSVQISSPTDLGLL